MSELKLLSTDVGVIVLSAGVGNDVCGWILLALTIALVNSGTGITALWVLMACLAWTLFLVYLVRPAFIWLLQRSGSIRNGPTQAIVALTLLLALTSAFFTGIIGVHPIFGAFLVGLICPHDGGFAIKLTEKIEDLVSTLFLPIYFTLSGLSTNIGLLNDGITWAYVVAVILTAFFGKVIGGTLAARFNKLVWKESFTIGVLMSCKGLIELIVLVSQTMSLLERRKLTSGKEYRSSSQDSQCSSLYNLCSVRFSPRTLKCDLLTFGRMALVTTFATTPIVSTIYTPAYQRKLAKWKRGEIDWDGNPLAPRDSDDLDGSFEAKLETKKIQKVLLYFRLDSLSSLFTFVALLSGSKEIQSTTRTHPAKRTSANDQAEAQNLAAKPLEVHGVRLVELTERTSTVMQISELDDHSSNDPVVNVLYTFGQMNNVAVSGGVAVVPEDSYGEALSSKAHDLSSDLVLIPWSDTTRATTLASSRLLSPDTTEHRFTAGSHNDFIQQSLANTSCNTAIIVNKGFGGLHGNRDEARSLSRTISGISMSSIRDRTPLAPISDLSHHVFMPYFGGADDQAALRFVLQLAQNTSVTATIVYVGMGRAPGSAGPHSSSVDVPETSHVASSLDKIRQKSGSIITHLTGQSKSTKIALGTHESDSNRAFYKTLQDSLPEALVSRVVFEDLKSAVSVQALFDKIQSEVGKSPKNAGDLIVVGRTHADEIDSALYEHNAGNGTSSEMGTSLGALAGAILRKGFPASLLMMQARTDHGRRH